MMKIKNALGVTLLLAVVSMNASADMVLDTFEYVTPLGGPAPMVTFDDDGFATIPDTYGAGSTPLATIASDAITSEEGTIIGLSVAQGLTVYDFNSVNVGNGAGSVANPNVVTGNGNLIVAASSETGYDLTISYSDPSGAVKANSQDFSASGDNFYFDIVSADFGSSSTFTVDVTVFDETGASSTAALAIPNGIIANQTLLLSFGSFAGVDFSKVSGVVAKIIAGGPALDIKLSEVGIVPEPASIALLGLGLLGLGLRSRKKSI